MKLPVPIAALLLLPIVPAGPLQGAPASGIGQLPGEKTPDVLRPKERNPFTRRETKSTEVTPDRESEESQLRALLGTMTVTGLVRGGSSDKVLLGSLVLAVGQRVQPLLKGQTEQLMVSTIKEREIEIQFIEADPHTEPRRILIPVDLHPRVAARYLTPPVRVKGEPNPAPE